MLHSGQTSVTPVSGIQGHFGLLFVRAGADGWSSPPIGTCSSGVFHRDSSLQRCLCGVIQWSFSQSVSPLFVCVELWFMWGHRFPAAASVAAGCTFGSFKIKTLSISLAHVAHQRILRLEAPEDGLEGPAGDGADENFRLCLQSTFPNFFVLQQKQKETNNQPEKKGLNAPT